MGKKNKAAILITGIGGNLGKTIARILHRHNRVVGIDRRPFPDRPKDIEHHMLDIRRKKAGDVFRRQDIDAVVHLGIAYDQRMPESERHAFNVLGTRQLLEHCAHYNVRKVVCLSSATVYGPDPDNSNFLTENSPLQAAIRHGEIRDLVEVDMYAQSFFWRYPAIETVIIRPVHIVGPTVRNTASFYFRQERPWMLTGFDPIIQLIHQEDAARAIVLALRPGIKGIFNVTGPGEAPLSRIHSILGKKPRSVPDFVAYPLIRKLWKMRLSSFPPQELDHLKYHCVADGENFKKKLGFRPSFGLSKTVLSIHAQGC